MNEETGRLDVGKGRTERERFDLAADTAANDASRPGCGEGRRDGKHGSVQEQTIHGLLFTTGRKPGSDRNRRMRTRTYGGVAAGAGLMGQSPASRLGQFLFL